MITVDSNNTKKHGKQPDTRIKSLVLNDFAQGEMTERRSAGREHRRSDQIALGIYQGNSNEGPKDGDSGSLLGNYIQKFPSPQQGEPEKHVSRRKEAYNHRYGQYRLLWEWEQALQAEYNDTIESTRDLSERPEEARERLLELQREITLSKHGSRFCNVFMTPSERSNGKGEKIKTGMPKHPEIHTGYNGDTKRRYFVGPHSCGSPFFCLGCARRIYAHRREELMKLFEYCRNQRHSYFFVTLTHPHTNNQTLQETMAALGIMRRKLKAGAPWTRFKAKYGIYGQVTAMEVTHSDRAGWHPHFHMVFVSDRPELTSYELDDIQKFLSERWSNLAVKYGLVSSETKRQDHLFRGVRVDAGNSESQMGYLAKISDSKNSFEIASADTKQARGEAGMSHWDIAKLAHNGDSKYKALWFDFMAAMKGRVAVQWAHGLKTLVGVHDVADEALVQGKQAIAEYSISRGEYGKINQLQAHCEVLEACEAEVSGGETAIALVKRKFDIDLVPVVESQDGQLELLRKKQQE